MKALTRIHNILKRRGTITGTDTTLHLHEDSIEIRIKHRYMPKKKKYDTLYEIFKQCQGELEND